MARARSPVNIQAHIQGNITGQVIIGNHNIQIGDVHGGFVYVAADGKTPKPRPRAVPVLLRPRPATGMLDRQSEMATAGAALQAQRPVDLYGEDGVGKTTLLCRLAYDVPEARFPDGIVCLSARRRPAADLLQELFHAFYECDIPVKPTVTQLHHALGSKRALILLDDVELAREEVDELLGIAPGCVFLLCSLERRLWGEGCALCIQGLPAETAVELVQREVGRPLTAAEQPVVRQLFEAVRGNPLRLLQAVTLVAEGQCDLAELVAKAAGPAPAEALQRAAVDSRSQSKRRLLGVLVALRGAWVPAEHLAAITQLADAAAQLDSLHQQRLVEARQGRYRLADSLALTSVALLEVSAWSERTLAHLASWAEQHREDPQQLAAQAECLLAALELAMEGRDWSSVVRLARAIDGAFALAGWWESWKHVVECGLQGARALGDQSAEAWALHQLGTRALCLDEAASARQLLTEALHLWQSVGDEIGAGITENNLRLLLPTVAPPSLDETRPGPPGPGPKPVIPTPVSKAVGLILAIAVAVPVGWWVFNQLYLTPPAATLSLVAIDLTEVNGGDLARGVVTLDRAAPAGGADIALESSPPEVAQLPLRITVPARATQVPFEIQTAPVSEATRVTITATYQGVTRQDDIVIRAPTLTIARVAVGPSVVQGGKEAKGMVTLSAPAPPGGISVFLSASPESVTLPSAVTVAPGARSTTFPIATRPLSQPIRATITATLGQSHGTATLQVQVAPAKPVLIDLRLEPSTVTAGDSVQAIVTLSAPVPSDCDVALAATSEEAGPLGAAPAPATKPSKRASRPLPSRQPNIPQTVTVKAGSNTGQCQIVTGQTAAATSIRIAATYEGVTKTATLAIQPPEASLARIDLSPNPVVGGNPVTGTVVLSGPAPAGGKVIRLRSGNLQYARVQAQVTVAAGQTRAPFPVQTTAIPATTSIVIEGSDGAQSRSRELILAPPIRLVSFVLNPTKAGHGEPVQGTVGLSEPAPPGGARIALTSSNPTVVPVPTAFEISAGQTIGTFSIKTKIAESEGLPPVILTASYGSQSRQATIDVAILK